MKKLCFSKKMLLFSLVLIVLSVDVFAGARDHDGGFFLRLSGGVGVAQTTLGDNLRRLYGMSGDDNIAIGGGIFNNFSLHATIFGFLISEPEMEVLGVPVTTNQDILLSALGVGVTYYIMPANVYLSPSIGIGELSDGVDTDWGLALDLTLGKEWWVGGSWGLGMAGSFVFHSLPESNGNLKWEGFGLALRFSATLN